MKHTTEELILAVHVREAATRHRNAALAEAKKSADMAHKEFDAPVIGYTAADQQAIADAESARKAHRASAAYFDRDWLEANPVTEFVRPAMRELEQIATVMKTCQEETAG